jgi:putative oxidoreductase
MSSPERTSPQQAQYAALALRVALGVVFVAHALTKVIVFTLPGTAQFFEGHGFPGWTAYPVTLVELIGGTLLIAGLHTRAVALGLIPVLLGALTVHWANGWSFTAAGGGWEYVAFLIVALVAQALLGDGALAVSGVRHRPEAGRVLQSGPVSTST